MINNRKLLCTVLAVVATLNVVAPVIPVALAQDDMADSATGSINSATLGDLQITGAFARATLPNAPVGGGYMTIANTGATDDTLIKVASGMAQAVGLHEMALVGDIMRMGEVADGIVVPAGETVTLAPGGLHVMFMGLNQPFIEGECVEVTLTFEIAGDADLCLAVGTTNADAVGQGGTATVPAQ